MKCKCGGNIFALLCSFALVLALLPALAGTAAADTLESFDNTTSSVESGESYAIDDEADLIALSAFVADGTSCKNVTFVLTANITLTSQFTPIGSSDHKFQGTFDGDGYVISTDANGVIGSEGETKQGLFGYLGNSATVKNLGVNAAVVGSDDVGGIVGYNKGTVIDCYFIGALTSDGDVGGIVGYNAGSITTCYSAGTQVHNGSGDVYQGGVAAKSEGTVTNCYFDSNVLQDVAAIGYDTGETSSALGLGTTDMQGDDASTHMAGFSFGVVWKTNTGDFYPTLVQTSVITAITINTESDLIALSKMVSDGNDLEGVTVTLANDIVLTADFTPIGSSSARFQGTFHGAGYVISTADGVVIGDANETQQGLFGYVGTSAIVQNLGVDATVAGYDDVGGIAGYNAGTIESCYFIGTITSEDDAGGIVGYNSKNGTVQNCYNTGTVTSTGIGASSEADVGGIVGDNDGGTVQNCYSIGAVSGESTEDVNNVGAVVGNNDGGNVTKCYFDADIVSITIEGVALEYSEKTAIGLDNGSASDVTGVTTSALTGTGTGRADDTAVINFESEVWTFTADSTDYKLYYPVLKANTQNPAPYYDAGRTITFDSNGGSAVASIVVKEGTQVTAPRNPTRSGYIFVGWYYNSNAFDFSVNIAENMTLVAKWDAEPSDDDDDDDDDSGTITITTTEAVVVVAEMVSPSTGVCSLHLQLVALLAFASAASLLLLKKCAIKNKNQQ